MSQPLCAFCNMRFSQSMLIKRLKRLVKQLNKTVKNTGINTTVRGVFKGEQKINNYFKLKDKKPRNLQSNIVYSVKCLICEAEYIGKTTQHIDARIYQHKIVKDGQHGLTKSHIALIIRTLQSIINSLI